MEFKTNGTAIIEAVLNRYSSHYSIVKNHIARYAHSLHIFQPKCIKCDIFNE